MLTLLVSLLAWGTAASAGAQSPQPAPPGPTDSPALEPTPAPAASVRSLDERSRSVRALLTEQLDPAVDATSLLRISVDGASLTAEDLRTLLEQLPEARSRRNKRRTASRLQVDLEPSGSIDEARARLRDALLLLLALDDEDRDDLVKAHRERQLEARHEATDRAELHTRVNRLRLAREQWEALLAGSLDVSIDPTSLLRIDLTDPNSLATSPERLARATAPPAAASAKPDSVAPDDVAPDAVTPADPESIGALRREAGELERALDELRLRYWRMDPAQRRAVLERHAARQAEAANAAKREAEERLAAQAAQAPEIEAASRIDDAQAAADAAAAEMERALEAASKARSESLRLIAEERARLLGIKQTMALLDAELARRSREIREHHDAALRWASRANAVIEAVDAGRDPPEDPDTLHGSLRDELGEARARLGTALSEISSGESAVPEIGQPALDLGEAGTDELAELRAGLEARERELSAAESGLRWEIADSFRNDLVMLNRARLGLLEVTSSELQARMTGFGSDGVRQVGRELQQVGLELRYLGLALPRHARQVLRDVKTSPVPLIMVVLEFVGALLVFRWWRGRAQGLLADIHTNLDQRRPRTRWTRLAANIAWYLQRIRGPLEWLGLAYVFFRITGVIDVIPELRLAWLVVLWLGAGTTVIYFVDALAAHDQLRLKAPSPTAALRIRSLRVSGLTIVVVGLLLSLTSAIVGNGAIFAWVFRTCWILALPIVLMLVAWWKPHIFKVFAAEPAGRLSDWVNARTKGWASFAAATVGGAFLFVRGIVRWGMRRVATFDATRRVLAYLFRREVAKQAEATGQLETLEPLDPDRTDRLLTAGAELDPEVAADALAELQRVVAEPRATLSAIVGERGMGKTTLLRRLEAATQARMLVVDCPVDGFDALLAAMARALKASNTVEAIASALASSELNVVAIDGVQRLVRPTVGGMRGLDRLGELARQTEGEIAWIVTIGAAAWQYMSRARGEALFFDQTLRLAPWTEDQIGRLIQSRTAAAGIEPSFEGLVVPRQYDDAGDDAGNRSEIGFYRILWDYADGNPRVATLFWSRSLFIHSDQGVVVRLFKEPPSAPLDALALPIKFVLRTLVQLERATATEIAHATRMPLAEVEDALRFARARNYLEREDEVYTVSWPWFRAITNMLHRQHLLAT